MGLREFFKRFKVFFSKNIITIIIINFIISGFCACVVRGVFSAKGPDSSFGAVPVV